MSKQDVTILLPNFKTLELSQLCLRLIRKYTDLKQAEVIVIDNDSRDASLDYLRTVKWIRLLERKSIAGEPGHIAHSKALDLALSHVTPPFVLSIHTDTLVKNKNWLSTLLDQINCSPTIAGVGSWKLEEKNRIERVLKKIEQQMQLRLYRIFRNRSHKLAGEGKNHLYLRSHCALYRTALLHDYDLHFSDGDGVAGKFMHRALVERGHDMVFLPPESLQTYLAHINHATLALNPQLNRASKKTVSKGKKRIDKMLEAFNAQEILADTSLDS